MKVKSKGLDSAFLKRKAKSLKKQLGISHTTSLDLVVKQYGFKNWNEFNNQLPVTQVTKVLLPVRPTVPYPAVLDYHNVYNGVVIGQHPNTKMTPRNHKRLGDLLQDLLAVVEYHKRAKRVCQDIIATMDNWLGCEYNEAELGNEEFNSIYYGKYKPFPETRPSERQQQKYKRWLRRAKQLIDQNYHDCKPLEKLHLRFELAARLLDKWPKTLRIPKLNSRRITPGTFVRLIGKNQIGVAFHHRYDSESVVGYSDGGTFHCGRHEVRVLRKQLSLEDFKPMRLTLPYGKWLCEDGREVLFNRDYTPIWDRSLDNVVGNISPDTYVHHKDTVFYFDDATAPYYYENAHTLEKCLNVLKEWGVEDLQSEVLKLLPLAMTSGNSNLLSPKSTS